MALSPDGSLVAYTRAATGRAPDTNTVVIADAATGAERRTFSRPGHQYYDLAFTADGSTLVCQRQREETYDTAWRARHPRRVRAGFRRRDRPAAGLRHLAVARTAGPLAGSRRHHGVVHRGRAGALPGLPSRRGRHDHPPDRLRRLHLALCHTRWDHPLRAAQRDRQPAPSGPPGRRHARSATRLPQGSRRSRLPSRDPDRGAHPGGRRLPPAWLARPARGRLARAPGALARRPARWSQASWSAWTWSWNPWPFAARGYAVLLPDPALSTGYGQRMQERGRGRYGGQPYRDVIALTDAALARADLDATRTALAGWSYGGYLANVAATLTDRFKAIVSAPGCGTWRHCGPTRTCTPTSARSSATHGHSGNGTRPTRPSSTRRRRRRRCCGKDHRVPMGQALSLHSDLQRLGVPVRFLHFPAEGHTTGAPNHIRIMYETVLSFLDHHVLGKEWPGRTCTR
ncbi:prolyl oligopeptidase family serine peptidase [Streptomyces sp. NPDC005890]|uniref:prolyl oligopeptidase family serine peptidase n=1 Tax=Streptomyces sp. NPDC005890 TaxID=3154568 RepID=UPI0033F01E1A